MCFSLRGSVFEPSKRRNVGVWMYGVVGTVVAACVLTITASTEVWVRRVLKGCMRESLVIQLAVVMAIVMWVFFVVFLTSAFDPVGHRRYEALDRYSDVWWKRLQWFFCGCRARKGKDSAYETAASVLAQSFRAYNIVTSDIVAGILLLNGYQNISLRYNARQVQYLSPTSGRTRERVTVQSVICPLLTSEEKEILFTFREYSRFFLATYGIMLRNYMNCCTGSCEVFFHDPCTCCRNHLGKHYGTVTHCDLSTVLLVTGVPEENILFSQWKTDICKPVHFVAYNKDTDAIVVAIRGTMSLSDCITDMAAMPTTIELKDIPDGTPAEAYYVHGGIYESAKYVYKSLEYNGVLDDVLSGKYKNSKLVVLGHSLGAGVSLLLSTILWSDQPALRSRLQCLAYSPPGGLMSVATVEYCASFTFGCFSGQDMIPRIAQHTFDRFREEMFDVLAACKYPKAFMFLKCFQTSELVSAFHPSTPGFENYVVSPEAAAFRSELRHSNIVPQEEPKKLFPCKRLMHFRKMVEIDQTNPLCPTEEVYVPVIENPGDVQAILAAPSMFSDHFPNVLFHILETTCNRLESGDLERYFAPPNIASPGTAFPSLHGADPNSSTSIAMSPCGSPPPVVSESIAVTVYIPDLASAKV